MARNRYADLPRVLAASGVVYGHWLLISVTYRDGQLSGLDDLRARPPTAPADLRIAVAGPLASLGAGLVFGALAAAVRAGGGPALAVAALAWLAAMNVLLMVFNLLPGTPLDGGRILRAFLWRRHGNRVRAAQSAAASGRVVGAALMALGAAEILLWADLGGCPHGQRNRWPSPISSRKQPSPPSLTTAGSTRSLTHPEASRRVSGTPCPTGCGNRTLTSSTDARRQAGIRPDPGPARTAGPSRRHRPRRRCRSSAAAW